MEESLVVGRWNSGEVAISWSTKREKDPVLEMDFKPQSCLPVTYFFQVKHINPNPIKLCNSLLTKHSNQDPMGIIFLK